MSNSEPVVVVKDLYKSFRLPHEQSSGLKHSIVNFIRQKKGYEIQKVLNDVSFEINKGEFFGIVGRNGSGKSTLLKLLAGIYTPDSGLVHINGSLTPFIELGVGFNPELTGRENVYLNGALLGFSRTEMEAMYEDIVSFAELERFMDQKLKNYSSGMQVRLAFSIAIRANTDILLIDEVLAVGDSAFQQKCFDYFQKLKEDKKTIILVTHDMSAVKRFCTSAVYVKNGEVTAYGTPEEVADVYLVDNIESSSQETAKGENETLSSSHRLVTKITQETPREVELEFEYSSNDSSPMYIGLSILKDGVSVAEINSKDTLSLDGNGKAAFAFSKGLLNQGVYEVTAVLCSKKAQRLLTLSENRVRFVVGGNDSTRGGALKLDDTWQVAV